MTMITGIDLKSKTKVSNLHGLDFQYLNEILTDTMPPDELIEGVLVNGCISMIYGPSNVGKTFLAIDLACSIATGEEWHGRKCEKGLVVYLAVESPNSVMSRCLAYKNEYKLDLENLCVVQTAVNMFSDPNVVSRITSLVEQVESERGLKVKLIVGDTLSILSTGADENTGRDMSIVMENIKKINSFTGVHFMVVHHSGKAAASKARGWSGVRACIDTEMEVVSTANKQYLEITKQRDLDTKGLRISFELKKVDLGISKFGSPISTCVVAPAESEFINDKESTRIGGVEKKLLTYVMSEQDGVSIIKVKEYFINYYRQTIERALKNLIKKNLIVERESLYYAAENLRQDQNDKQEDGE